MLCKCIKKIYIYIYIYLYTYGGSHLIKKAAGAAQPKFYLVPMDSNLEKNRFRWTRNGLFQPNLDAQSIFKDDTINFGCAGREFNSRVGFLYFN